MTEIKACLAVNFFKNSFFVFLIVRSLFCQKLGSELHVLQHRVLRKKVEALENKPEVQAFFANFAFPLRPRVGGIKYYPIVYQYLPSVRTLKEV